MRIASAAILLAVALAGCASIPPYRQRNDQILWSIQPGMSRQEVERIAGPPDETMRFRPDLMSMDYYYWDTWGYYCLFSVMLDGQDVVQSRLSARIRDGGGRD